MHIQDRELRRIVNDEKEYRYGRIMDISSFLERMTISLDESNGCYRVNARFVYPKEKQSAQSKQYTLSLKINNDGEVIYHTCSCDTKGACRHIAAILFYLRKQNITEYPYFYEKTKKETREQQLKKIEQQRQQRILSKKQQESLEFIDFYREQLLRESFIPLSLQQYQLKVIIQKENDHLLMTLKIMNHQQSYVIKNIEQFLNAIVHHESLKYGKYFEFVHSEDAFDADSLDILSFVRRCFIKNQNLQKGIMKSLIISDDDIDELYQLMSNLPSSYCDIAFDKKRYVIPLEIQDKEESYVLDLKDYQEFYGALFSMKHIYHLENDVLYCYEFQEEEKTFIFIRKLLEVRGGLYIPKDSLMDFYKYILIDIMDDIIIDTRLFNDYQQENFINLYGDMTDDEQIYLQLEYIYDDKMAYGFDENNHHLSKKADLIENYLRPYIEDIDDHHIYLKYDHEFSYQFMKEGLPYLSHYCQIYVTDALSSFEKRKPIDIHIGVNMSHGLLSMTIESSYFQKEELIDILKAYKRKRKFYKLKDGQILSLDNKEFIELNEMTENFQIKLNDLASGEVEIPSYRLFELDSIMNQDNSIQYSKGKELKKWLDNIEMSKQQALIPSSYQNTLRQYQKDGYQWLRLMQHYGFGGILADDMGLGKTLQIIVYFESMKNEGVHLVITPASLLLNWQDEIQKFSSQLRVLPIYGKKSIRDQLILDIEQYDVVITSYDYLRRDIDLYDQKQFHTVVIDEAQYIKNPKTRNAMAVKRLKAKQRFALTGTPIENSLAELWSIFDFLMPYYLYNYSYFLNHYERPIVKEKDEKKQQKLKQMIQPFVLRRNKKDVLLELPDKIEQTLFLHFNENEEKIYMANLVLANQSLQKKLDIQQLGKVDILAMLTRLRQICQEPRLLYEDIQEPSSKLKGCMELIHSLKDNGKKILLFSSFTSVLHLIEKQCIKEHISYYLLDGTTSKEKRKEMVDQFQQDQTTLFLISLKAGGSGLNLTSAQAVIHYDPWWNMSAKNQATDRAHRIGQKETVQVFSLIMKNSIEEKIMELQSQKKNLADTFVEGNDGSISTMSIEDMKALFEIS